ncbi:hypothetical protein CVS40_8287 [Lucilia cuprina]|nr:hypothetical protein CVS40_8287 [Lucilia cuprina]
MLKNPSSWSILGLGGFTTKHPHFEQTKPAMDSFQQFRNKAKEKADRQKAAGGRRKGKRTKTTKKKQPKRSSQRKQHHSKSSHMVGGGGAFKFQQ